VNGVNALFGNARLPRHAAEKVRRKWSLGTIDSNFAKDTVDGRNPILMRGAAFHCSPLESKLFQYRLKLITG
jgi:hypothetical protein